MLMILFYILLTVLGLVALAALAGLGWMKLKVDRETQRRHLLRAKERIAVEEADWIGRTGLAEDVERELPRYLRRERNETLFDEDALKAADLRYLGRAPEGGGTTHYWYVPQGREEVYAFVDVAADGSTAMGWGGARQPPEPMRAVARGLREAAAAR
jgi:hypothetical protein